MEEYDESYVREAEREVRKLWDAALEKVRRTHPEIGCVIDRRTIDDYSGKTWEYPGRWYYAGFRLPEGFSSREELIDDIVKQTLRYFRAEPEKRP